METFPLVKRVRPENSSRIWEIRNTLQSRQASKNQDEVPWEKHESWFQRKYIKNESNACFVLDYDGETAGYCRFDLENGSFRVSIALEPAYHGRGFGSLFLIEACAQFGKDKNLVAEVKRENESSIRIFKKAGFNITNKDDKYSYFERRAQ
ncbi:MAG: GNAT family N-acetyltransferase [Patescibacteria group bacterium]